MDLTRTLLITGHQLVWIPIELILNERETELLVLVCSVKYFFQSGFLILSIQLLEEVTLLW